MKKQITILTFLFFHCFFLWSQHFVRSDIPCNDEMLLKLPGKWNYSGSYISVKGSKQVLQEISKRADSIHQLLYRLYPSPVSIDASAYNKVYENDFASQLVFDRTAGYLREDPVNGISLINFYCVNYFSPFNCGRTTNEYSRGFKENSTAVYVYTNTLSPFITNAGRGEGADLWVVDGRPVYYLNLKTGKWKGYDVYAIQGSLSEKRILLHREGMLPYIPVTRKQYFDICFARIQTSFTPDSSGLAVIASLYPDKEKKDAYIKEEMAKGEKNKNQAMKHLQDELSATTRAGLLDAPAIITTSIFDGPLFTTEDKGSMLVVENPNYIRKDLPKYVPQIIVLVYQKMDWGRTIQPDPNKLFEQDYPIEKLQAMIDK